MSMSVPECIGAVVVPLDGSSFSLLAVPIADWLAGALDAEVHLLSTVDSVEEVPERERALADVALPGRRVHHTVVVDRDPAGEIHETLRRLAPAVACMASHGRGRSAALLGSVAADVIARGHDPIVVVGPEVEQPWPDEGVVAGVDPTSVSVVTVLPVALGWGRLLGEPVRVVTVAEPVPEPVGAGPARRRFGPPGDVEHHLRQVVEPYASSSTVEVEALTVWDPIGPADGLVSYLRFNPASLVVVGAHARAGVRRLLDGSEAAVVARRSVSPVLMVPLP
jgi:nucleotide-binding universal stress UspA family protein